MGDLFAKVAERLLYLLWTPWGILIVLASLAVFFVLLRFISSRSARREDRDETDGHADE